MKNYEHHLVEGRVSEFWQSDNTFHKSVEARQEPFTVYEGPPTANGKPGIHHVLVRAFKDAIARYQTMRGKRVERIAGWDEHGLPVEVEVQKALNLHSKSEIATYGIDKFNKACQESTQKYIKEWENLTSRMGYWLDFERAYRTSSKKYIVNVWKVFEELYDEKLIYKDNKVVPWACDSGTVVSNAEMSQGYKEVTHSSAYVLFDCIDNVHSFLVWTTTPWTLPANMALAVNPDLEYKVFELDGRKIISLMEFGKVVDTVKGKDLIGQVYRHPFFDKKGREENFFKVFGADFVKAEKTGIVHIAPGFGEDDYNLYKKEINAHYLRIMSSAMLPEDWKPSRILDPVVHVDEDGKFNLKAPAFLQGIRVTENNFKTANDIIIQYLTLRDLIFKVEDYKHEYPHNWRTGKPLIYLLRPSYFFRTTSLPLSEVNKKINWFPSHIKEGRFGEWLKGDVDWSISRERFWGTPLPLFDNGARFDYPHDVHRPAADDGKRVREVLDCWFDSGCMPFAAYDKYRKADFICEAIDQTRGWFYSLLAISVALTGDSCYKNVVCLGHVLDKNGHKMSKSKKNTVDPLLIFDTHGADATRWYMARNPVGNSLLFDEKNIRLVTQNFINKIWNCHTFLQTYAAIDKPKFKKQELNDVSDKWLMARLQETINVVTASYESFNLHVVCTQIEQLVEDLSNVWVRFNRERFWNTDSNKKVDENAYYVLREALTTICALMAPIAPFVSEYLWLQYIVDSVHLQNWPLTRNLTEDENNSLKKMREALEAIQVGMKLRDEAKIKLRQPLSYFSTENLDPSYLPLVQKELNVKQVDIKVGDTYLETKLDDDLIAEGVSRDFVRNLQVLRKKMGMEVSDRILLITDYNGDDLVKKQLESRLSEIHEKLLVSQYCEGKGEHPAIGNVKVSLSKI